MLTPRDAVRWLTRTSHALEDAMPFIVTLGGRIDLVIDAIENTDLKELYKI